MNKLTATILSTISLSGAALIAAALFSTTTAHSAPIASPTGDAVIGAVSVVEDLGGSAVTVSEAAPARKAAKASRPFEMTHVARVATSETVNNYRRTRSLSGITFDLAPQL